MNRLIWLAPFLFACGKAADVDAILELEGDPAAGETLFAANCASCHGADATGGSGPDLTGEDEDEEFVEYVLNGDGDMPAFEGDLTDQEIADILAWVKEQ
jgi:menaquinol-cytochrome c reductase cytochrome b/c subunit